MRRLIIVAASGSLEALRCRSSHKDTCGPNMQIWPPKPTAGSTITTCASSMQTAAMSHLAKREKSSRGGRRCSLGRSEEHTSELQSLMRISYAVFCLKKKTNTKTYQEQT